MTIPTIYILIISSCFSLVFPILKKAFYLYKLKHACMHAFIQSINFILTISTIHNLKLFTTRLMSVCLYACVL